jgi:hypothetical protein
MQQNRPKADIPSCAVHVRFWGKMDINIGGSNVILGMARKLGSV